MGTSGQIQNIYIVFLKVIEVRDCMLCLPSLFLLHTSSPVFSLVSAENLYVFQGEQVNVIMGLQFNWNLTVSLLVNMA